MHAATGTGKSYAVWLAVVREWLAENPHSAQWPQQPEPLRVLWITPMRALANDILVSLRAPLADLAIPWTVDARTGDTSEAVRRQQRQRLPTALVTTPESLSLMLSYTDARERLRGLRMVVVDEWHELLGTKRGVQTELGLARLRGWNPALRTWGLSATLGNLDEALKVLFGAPPYVASDDVEPSRQTGTTLSAPDHHDHLRGQRADAVTAASRGTLVAGRLPKKIAISTMLPDDVERFPWSGHLGVKLLPDVVQQIDAASSTLLFTNTRSQAEIWFHKLLAARPGLGCRDRLASWFAGSDDCAAMLSDDCASRHAALRGLHVEPRPRRRLFAGRPGYSSRQPQRSCPTAAVRRSQRTPTRAL